MKAVNASEINESSKFGKFHLVLMFWFFLIIVFDGYDIAIYGAVVPVLMKEWSLSSVVTGAIGSYTVVGTAVGAILFGFLADKIGRKKVILICVTIFSLFTALAGFATGPMMFAIFRVTAGLGIGGVMPNVIALVTEFSPKKMRGTMVSLVFCGYSIGAMSVALISKSILPTMGWKPLYWIAAIPLLFLPFLAKILPESLPMLAAKEKNEEIRRILAKSVPNHQLPSGVVFQKQTSQEQKGSFTKLLANNRARSTFMFWFSSFSCFIFIYAMNTWLPKLLIQANYDLGASLTALAIMNVGAIVGTVIFGPLTDKIGFKKVIIPLYLAGALALTLVGTTNNVLIANFLIAIVGAASVGIQNLLNPLVSQYYPADMRSAGVGMTMGFGRIGGIVSPILIGLLLAQNFSVQMNFAIISLAGVIGAVAIFFVQEQHGNLALQKKNRASA